MLADLKKQPNFRNIEIPEITILDKNTNLVDDASAKQKLKNNQRQFAFASFDRSRGFDFPGSPHLIATAVVDKALNEQILGRTARNDRNGTITYAYWEPNEEEDATDLSRDDFEQKMKEITDKKVEDFNKKNKYFELVAEISDKLSLFLNRVTFVCEDKKQQVYDQAYNVIGNYLNFMKEKFDTILPLEDEFNEEFDKFSSTCRKDLLKLYENIYNFSYFPAEEVAMSVQDIAREVDNEYSNIFAQKKVEYDGEFEPENVEAGDRLDQVEVESSIIKFNDGTIIDVNKIDNVGVKNYLLFLGSANSCNFKIKPYSINANVDANNNIGLVNYDVVIAKKDIVDNDEYGQPCIKSKEIAFISNIDNKEGILPKIKTLSPDAMIVYQNAEGFPAFVTRDVFLKTDIEKLKQQCADNFKKIAHELHKATPETLKSDEEPDFKDLEKWMPQYVINGFVSFYTENGLIPTADEVARSYADKVENIQKKVENTNTEDEEVLLKNKFNEIVDYKNNANLKNGLLFAKRNNFLALNTANINNNIIANKTDEENKKIVDDYKKEIEKYSHFNIELSDEEKKQIEDDKSFFSEILISKIGKNSNSIIDLVEKIEKDDDLSYEDKQKLLFECDKITSKENLIAQTERIMRLVATPSMYELLATADSENKVIRDLDLFIHSDKVKNIEDWQNNITIDNVESVLEGIDNIKNAQETANSISDKIKNICEKEEKNLKQMLSYGNNNVADNIKLLEKNAENIKIYKDECENQKTTKSFFNGFKQDNGVDILINDLQLNLQKYQKFMNDVDNDRFITPRQKTDVRQNFVNSFIEGDVNLIMSEENIDKIFNDLSLHNYDPKNIDDDVMFGVPSTVADKQLMKDIIEKYKQCFEKIHNEHDYENLEEQEIDEDEEEQVETEKQKHKRMFNEFKQELITLIKQHQVENSEDKVNNANDFLIKMMTAMNNNYQVNLAKKEEIINDCVEKITAVANSFRNVYNAHDDFKKQLLKILEEHIPNFDKKLNVNSLITNNSLSTLKKDMEKVDLPNLQKMQNLINKIVENDLNDVATKVRALEMDANDIPKAFKVLLVVCTFGLILLTDKGKKMFDEKQVLKRDKKIKPNFSTKKHMLREEGKEQEINKELNNTVFSTKAKTIVENNTGNNNYNNESKNISTNTERSLEDVNPGLSRG